MGRRRQKIAAVIATRISILGCRISRIFLSYKDLRMLGL
ncbi:hypothetical protein PSN_5597 [Pseudomonas sp. NGC7]